MSRGREAERLALYVREDVRDAVRERQLYLLCGVFALVGAGVAYLAGRSAAGAPRSFEIELAGQLLDPLAFLIPLAALGFVAPALVQKRTSGALTVLLGLPFTRRTVVLGAFLGRSAVLGIAVLAAVLVALPVGLALGVSVDPLRLVVVGIALLALAITFTGIAVSISAVARSSTVATVAAFGAYVVFALGVWGNLPMLALYVRHGFAYPETIPAWVDAVHALNPMTAFGNVLAGLDSSLGGGVGGAPPMDPALYEQPAVAFGILVAWVVVSVGFGIRRFRATDL